MSFSQVVRGVRSPVRHGTTASSSRPRFSPEKPSGVCKSPSNKAIKKLRGFKTRVKKHLTKHSFTSRFPGVIKTNARVHEESEPRLVTFGSRFEETAEEEDEEMMDVDENGARVAGQVSLEELYLCATMNNLSLDPLACFSALSFASQDSNSTLSTSFLSCHDYSTFSSSSSSIDTEMTGVEEPIPLSPPHEAVTPQHHIELDQAADIDMSDVGFQSPPSPPPSPIRMVANAPIILSSPSIPPPTSGPVRYSTNKCERPTATKPPVHAPVTRLSPSSQNVDGGSATSTENSLSRLSIADTVANAPVVPSKSQTTAATAETATTNANAAAESASSCKEQSTAAKSAPKWVLPRVPELPIFAPKSHVRYCVEPKTNDDGEEPTSKAVQVELSPFPAPVTVPDISSLWKTEQPAVLSPPDLEATRYTLKADRRRAKTAEYARIAKNNQALFEQLLGNLLQMGLNPRLFAETSSDYFTGQLYVKKWMVDMERLDSLAATSGFERDGLSFYNAEDLKIRSGTSLGNDYDLYQNLLRGIASGFGWVFAKFVQDWSEDHPAKFISIARNAGWIPSEWETEMWSGIMRLKLMDAGCPEQEEGVRKLMEEAPRSLHYMWNDIE